MYIYNFNITSVDITCFTFNFSVESNEPNANSKYTIKEEFLSDCDVASDSENRSIEKKKTTPKHNLNHQIKQKDESLKSIFEYELPVEKRVSSNIGVVHNPDNSSIKKNNFQRNSIVHTKIKIVSDLYDTATIIAKLTQTSKHNEKDVSESGLKRKKCIESCSSLQQPCKLSKSAVSCKLCKETFSTHGQLLLHMAVHYPNYICDTCEKAFAYKKCLIMHMKVHEGTSSCNICGKIVKSSFLSLHMDSHSNFKCPHCSDRFETVNVRHEHIRMVHADITMYNCEYCSKKFYFLQNLTKHVNRSHLRILNFICGLCDKRFFYKNELKNHMKIHSGVKDYECDICHKKFYIFKYLKKHLNNYHVKNNIFDCGTCGERFCDRQKYMKHSELHSNERNYECNICNKKYKTNNHLKEHLRVHNEKFKCSYCDKEYTYERTLRKHMNNKHNDDESVPA